MNREILFRGKAIDNGEWVYGYLTKHYYKGEFEFCIQYFDSDMDDKKRHNVIVDQNTIGQFTGLFDKNGVKIFEGDIVKSHSKNWIGEIKFFEGSFIHNEAIRANSLINDCVPTYCEVIGNIHDNPTLLKAEV